MEHCSSSCKKEKKIKQLDEDLGGEFPVGKVIRLFIKLEKDFKGN